MVSGHIQYRCDETVVPIPRCIKTPVNRPALVEMQQIYRIILSLYRCIDVKPYRYRALWYIDISWLEIIVHCGQLKWYMMLLKGKKHHLFLLKVTQNNVLTSLCIEQYIAVSWYIRGNISILLHTVSLQL